MLKLINIVNEAIESKIEIFIRDEEKRSMYFGKAIGEITAPKLK